VKLLLLLIVLAGLVQVTALPERARLYEEATYVVSTQSSDPVSVEIDATLTNVRVSTTPDVPCLVSGKHPLLVVCQFPEPPGAITIRGKLDLGTRALVTVSSGADKDYQFVSGTHTLFLPTIRR
jgi:hypothetical protein